MLIFINTHKYNQSQLHVCIESKFIWAATENWSTEDDFPKSLHQGPSCSFRITCIFFFFFFFPCSVKTASDNKNSVVDKLCRIIQCHRDFSSQSMRALVHSSEFNCVFFRGKHAIHRRYSTPPAQHLHAIFSDALFPLSVNQAILHPSRLLSHNFIASTNHATVNVFSSHLYNASFPIS